MWSFGSEWFFSVGLTNDLFLSHRYQNNSDEDQVDTLPIGFELKFLLG